MKKNALLPLVTLALIMLCSSSYAYNHPAIPVSCYQNPAEGVVAPRIDKSMIASNAIGVYINNTTGNTFDLYVDAAFALSIAAYDVTYLDGYSFDWLNVYKTSSAGAQLTLYYLESPTGNKLEHGDSAAFSGLAGNFDVTLNIY